MEESSRRRTLRRASYQARRFSGTFSYDPTGTPSGGIGFEGFSQATYGHSLNYPGSVADGSGLTLQIGGQTILANPGGVSVALSEIDYTGQYGYRDASGLQNPYTSVTISNENVDGGPLEVALGLTNPTLSLSNSFYPLTLAEFPDAQLGVTLFTNPGSETLYTGTIDSLVEVAVPEPVCRDAAVPGRDRLVHHPLTSLPEG